MQGDSRQETNQLQVEENHENHPNGLSHFSICNNLMIVNTGYRIQSFPIHYREM
jgi:hypothetical protein